MKIVHLIDYFQPKLGYQETYLAREQIKTGHDVAVITSDRYAPFPNYDETFGSILGVRLRPAGEKIEEGIRTLRLKSIEIPSSVLVHLRGLKEAIGELVPDIVHCHGIFSTTSYRIAQFKKDIPYRLVYDSHAASFNTDFDRSLLRKAYKVFYKHFFWTTIQNAADVLFAIGVNEQRFLNTTLGIDVRDVPIIHLGADTEMFKHSASDRKMMRQKLRIGADETVIIYTGKITENKDLHVLFDACSHLDMSNTRLLIIGGGKREYIQKLKSTKASGRALWIDFVENRTLPEYYSASDIAVWPGDSTIAILEAMGCSLPVVLPVDMSTEYLDESDGVCRFRRGDNADLSGQIRTLIQDAVLRRQMGRSAHAYVLKHLSWTIIAQKVMQHYST